jgi:pyrimidine operon attenuation protein/uracil phosphoribosyltransferase
VDVDYVEDDYAREKLVKTILQSVQGTDLEILVLSNDVYYLGLTVRTCQNALHPIMTTRKMTEQIAACSILFQRELKKVGLFKYLEGKVLRVQEPVVIQCERIHPMTA